MSAATFLVRDQLFLFAHDDHGIPRIDAACLAIGLSAAVLADLVLQERLTTEGPHTLGLRDQRPHSDPICAFVLETLGRHRDARNITAVLQWLATDITARTAGKLFAAGLVRSETRKKIWRSDKVLYRPTRPEVVTEIRAALTYAVNGSEYTGPPQPVLCGLVRILRLERELKINASSGELLDRLHDLASTTTPPVRDVLGVAQHLVESQANAAVRM